MHRSNRLAALTLAALVAVPAALTAEGHAPKLTGEWNLEFAAPWGMVVWTFDLEQEGTAINGTADPGMGTMVLDYRVLARSPGRAPCILARVHGYGLSGRGDGERHVRGRDELGVDVHSGGGARRTEPKRPIGAGPRPVG
jgi:hypothetical protein